MKQLTKQEIRDALQADRITIVAGSWRIRHGKYIADEWILECSEGKFRRSITSITCWHRWVGSTHTSSDRAWQPTGHWRRCGYRQEEQLDKYFAEATKLNKVKNIHHDDTH